MANEVDLALEALGSNSFRPISATGFMTTRSYENAVKLRGLSRTLKQISCGADGDINSNVTDLMTDIGKAVGNDFKRLGIVCLIGNSNGCSVVLGLAKALQKKDVKLAYLGIGDLTLMPFGRDPPINDIGNLQPANQPELGLLMRANPFAGGFARALPISASDIPPPRIADPGIKAGLMENFYTRGGNRVRVFTQSPAGKDNWWWTSTMKFGEIHGKIDGWTNLERFTNGADDDLHHTELCGKAISEARSQAEVTMLKELQKAKP